MKKLFIILIMGLSSFLAANEEQCKTNLNLIKKNKIVIQDSKYGLFLSKEDKEELSKARIRRHVDSTHLNKRIEKIEEFAKAKKFDLCIKCSTHIKGHLEQYKMDAISITEKTGPKVIWEEFYNVDPSGLDLRQCTPTFGEIAFD